MNSTILNRDFEHPADGWYHIEAKGNHPNHAAGVVQVIDDEATQSIVNRFNADASAGKLRHGNEMLIDHEHFSDQADQETRAYGWLQQLQNRDDGIYGQIRWSKTGKEAVDGGDYRFFSTEYSADDLKVLNKGNTPSRVRPLRLDGLTLTNMNNNRGQKPITNRRILNGDVDGHDFHGNQWTQGVASARAQSEKARSASAIANKENTSEAHQTALKENSKAAQMHTDLARQAKVAGDRVSERTHEQLARDHDRARQEHFKKAQSLFNREFFAESEDLAASNQNQNERTKTMNTIASKLGLAAEASEVSILAAVTTLQNRVTELTPHEAENKTLKNRLGEIDGEQVEGLMDAHGIKADDASRAKLKPVLLGMKNREERVTFLKDCVKPAATANSNQARTINRGDGKGAQPELTAADEAGKAQKIRNRAESMKATHPGVPFETRWAMATQEVNEGK